MLQRVGSFAARRRWWVVGVWLALAIGMVVLAGQYGGTARDVFTIPGTESQDAIDLLDTELPAANDPTATVVFHATDGKVTDSDAKSAVEDSIKALGEIDDASTSDPFTDPLLAGNVSSDEETVYTSVTFTEQISDIPKDVVDQMQDATKPATEAGLEVAFGGTVVDVYDAPTSSLSDHADDIGLLLALVILLISLRSGIAALMPIGTALFALGISTTAVDLLESAVTIGTIAPILGTMLGLGVGIDYSLFIVSRYRQELVDGTDARAAVGRSVGTAGAAVLFAAITVCLALVALSVMGIPYVRTLGIVTALYVAITVAAALTLLPALLTFAGPRVLSRHARKAEAAGESPTSGPTLSERWGRFVTGHPWTFAVAGVAVLAALSIPLLTSLDLGLPSDSSAPEGSTQREAYDLVTEGFGPGANGPLLVVGKLESPSSSSSSSGSSDDSSSSGSSDSSSDSSSGSSTSADEQALVQLEEFIKAIDETDGVDRVVPGTNPPDFTIVLVEVIPTTGPNSPETTDLVNRLRDDVVPQAAEGTIIDTSELYVGGATAEDIDLTDRIESRLALQFLIVIGGSFLLLVAVFRSVLVAVKAAALNLLSIGASLGVLVAVFEWGWLRDAIGLQETVVIASFVPVMLFAILFGLSMDYEVFLMSRIREAHLAGEGPRQSVVTGVSLAARVIVSAASIMIAVFLAFVTNPGVTVKMMGLGMALAVLIDASIARMVLVPSIMTLFGKRAWWLPHWLDRLLPNIRLDVPPADSSEGAPDAPRGQTA